MISLFNNLILNIQNSVSQLPSNYQLILALFSYTILTFFYAIFVWKVSKLLAKIDILDINLSQYGSHNTFKGFLTFIEYIVLMPIFVFIWFTILSLFLMVMSKNQSSSQILLISTGIVAAIRLCTYYSQELGEELAKLLPFTLLGIFLFDPSFFSITIIVSRFKEIPELITLIPIYLIFIFILEILIRGIYIVADSLGLIKK
ncbi:MAG TPA: hypothetical protein P5277_01450 [Candidatus Paceibacterota bacterium]|nr:hypothetical protein [Candidatus Paceibacterota bacterium]